MAVNVAELKEKLEARLGADKVKLYDSVKEFDPIRADPAVVHVVMSGDKPHVYFDTRDTSLEGAVPVQKKRPVITLVNKGDEKHYSMLESATVGGAKTTRNLPAGGLLNVELPPRPAETLEHYDARVDTLQKALADMPPEQRFGEVFAMSERGEVNLYSPPANKFGKLYEGVPAELPEIGKYKPKPEPRAAYRVNFDAILPVPDTWRSGDIASVPVENRSMVTDAGSVLVMIDKENVMEPLRISHERDMDGKLNHPPQYRQLDWETGKPDAYFVAGSASGTYASATGNGVEPPTLNPVPLSKNVEAAVDVIASMQPERAKDFGKRRMSTRYTDRDGKPVEWEPRSIVAPLNDYTARMVAQLRHDQVLPTQSMDGVMTVLSFAVARATGIGIKPGQYEGPQGEQDLRADVKDIAKSFLGGWNPDRPLPKNHGDVQKYCKAVVANARPDHPFKDNVEKREKLVAGFLEEMAYQHFNMEKLQSSPRVAAAGKY